MNALLKKSLAEFVGVTVFLTAITAAGNEFLKPFTVAIALGLKLDQEEDVHRVLHHTDAPAVQDARTHAVVHLRARAWTELRGLLVLRYELERHLIEDMGLHLSRRILEDAELHLTIAGFHPGIDGLHLDIHHLFGDPSGADAPQR